VIYGNIILERRSMSRIPVRMHLGDLRKDTVLDPCPNIEPWEIPMSFSCSVGVPII